MPVVFPQGTGKIVTTGKITFGTEKHIIVVLIIQYRIDYPDRGHTYRSGRKACIFIGIVRRVYFHMFIQHPSDGEISPGKFQGRTSF